VRVFGENKQHQLCLMRLIELRDRRLALQLALMVLERMD
jgi:hypothetical protein